MGDKESFRCRCQGCICGHKRAIDCIEAGCKCCNLEDAFSIAVNNDGW